MWSFLHYLLFEHLSPTPTSTTTLAWENSPHYATPQLVSPRNDVWKSTAEIPYWSRDTTQIWVVLLIGWNQFLHDQSEALPRSDEWHVIIMEFLRSFLRRHFVRKPVVTSPNAGCFLRLPLLVSEAIGSSMPGFHKRISISIKTYARPEWHIWLNSRYQLSSTRW